MCRTRRRARIQQHLGGGTTSPRPLSSVRVSTCDPGVARPEGPAGPGDESNSNPSKPQSNSSVNMSHAIKWTTYARNYPPFPAPDLNQQPRSPAQPLSTMPIIGHPRPSPPCYPPSLRFCGWLSDGFSTLPVWRRFWRYMGQGESASLLVPAIAYNVFWKQA